MIAYLGSLKPPSVIPPPVAPYNLDYVVVAGGGAGCGARTGNNAGNGGGGAGGYLSGTLTAQTAVICNIYIGAGGRGARSLDGGGRAGSNTIFESNNSTVFAIGGGSDVGKNGGSGSGSLTTNPVGLGTAGQGNNGANGPNNFQIGGGGGAGQVGATGSTTAKGGDGLTWVDNITRAGGGGGNRALNDSGQADALSGLGGAGGGGRGANSDTVPAYFPEAGNVNTGGGGGCGWPTSGYEVGGNGGSGIVKVRYTGTPRATGGTITQNGGFTYHEFTSSGRLIFTS
jgi:hypothetical protein